MSFPGPCWISLDVIRVRVVSDGRPRLRSVDLFDGT